tara:strand:+ start:1010 stop:1189 length:180 start_codon:yes stop_codon:yes gene_type:complete
MTSENYRKAMNLVIELEQVTEIGTNAGLDKLTRDLRIELAYSLRKSYATEKIGDDGCSK